MTDFVLAIQDFSYYAELYGYLGIFIFFAGIDQFSPLPSEFSLITIGYLSMEGMFNPFLAGGVSLAGFLTIDAIIFYLTRAGSRYTDRLQGRVNQRLMRTIERKFRANLAKAIIGLCFVPRMRVGAPIVSSLINVPFRRFMRYDLIGLLLFTTLYISLGMLFRDGLQQLFARFQTVQNMIFFLIVLTAAIALGVFFWARRAEEEEE